MSSSPSGFLSPSTYYCNLCDLTYGVLAQKGEWKDFIRSLSMPAEFLHKDEFIIKYPSMNGIELPALLSLDGHNKMKVLLSSPQMKQASSLEELIQLVKQVI